MPQAVLKAADRIVLGGRCEEWNGLGFAGKA